MVISYRLNAGDFRRSFLLVLRARNYFPKIIAAAVFVLIALIILWGAHWPGRVETTISVLVGVGAIGLYFWWAVRMGLASFGQSDMQVAWANEGISFLVSDVRRLIRWKDIEQWQEGRGDLLLQLSGLELLTIPLRALSDPDVLNDLRRHLIDNGVRGPGAGS